MWGVTFEADELQVAFLTGCPESHHGTDKFLQVIHPYVYIGYAKSLRKQVAMQFYSGYPLFTSLVDENSILGC